MTAEYILHGAAIFVLLTQATLWILHLIALFYSRWKLYKDVSIPPDIPLPGVSILKPIVGHNPSLPSNLETFFTLEYPLFEILFCVEDEKNLIVDEIRTLMTRHPNVPTKIMVGGARVGINPKVNNIQPALETANYELLLISDESIRMRPDTLKDMVAHMRPEVALVHQMPFTADRPGFAAALEKVYFGTVHARMYLASDFLRIICHNGMSSMVRREALEEIGGFAAVADYLAEDFFLAKALLANDWRLSVCSLPALQNRGQAEVRAFAERLIRWTRLRFAMVPVVTLIEPLSECLVLGALSGWAAHRIFGWEPAAVLACHVLIWFLLDWFLLCAAQGDPFPMSKKMYLVAWLFREVTCPLIFLLAMARRTVSWGSQTFHLAWGGRATKLETHAK